MLSDEDKVQARHRFIAYTYILLMYALNFLVPRAYLCP